MRSCQSLIRIVVPALLAFGVLSGVRNAAAADDESASSEPSDKPSDDGKGDSSGEGAVKKSTDAKAAVETPKELSGHRGGRLALALHGGYGTGAAQHLGVGGRAGWHLGDLFYAGATGTYFFGSQESASAFGETTTYARRSIAFGGEIGIEVNATPELFLRPVVGLGMALARLELCTANCDSTTNVRALMSPGILGGYRLGAAYVGADVHYVVVFAEPNSSGAVVTAVLGLDLGV